MQFGRFGLDTELRSRKLENLPKLPHASDCDANIKNPSSVSGLV